MVFYTTFHVQCVLLLAKIEFVKGRCLPSFKRVGDRMGGLISLGTVLMCY